MRILRTVDLIGKLKFLGQAAQYDLCGACSNTGKRGHRRASPLGRWIYPAVLPDGREIMLLKVLMSNACDNNCAYCANRRSKDGRRLSFEPDELAKLYMMLWERGLVQGLFLSSALAGNVERTQERMLAVLEILRMKYRFRGYIHVKILPGASMASVERATQLAQRVSVNLEAPGQRRLKRIASDKSFEGLLQRMRWIKGFLDERGDKAGGQTTQFVVGASGECDKEIVSLMGKLYSELNLRRVYYSAFQPIPGTPMENVPATPLLREHRLYQVDFLFRKYNFRVEEIPFDENGNLPLDADPKTLWAKRHPEFFPIEVNRAPLEELLRVPGIGPLTARRIVKLRGQSKIRSLEQLKSLGAVGKRAAQYVLLDGRTPEEAGRQIALFR